MNVYRLCWLLLKTIFRGKGNAEILFDTEAKKFDYHMAKVGSAYCEKHAWPTPAITLHEER